MTGACEICGGPGADALCVKCCRVVCERCFHGFGELCVECAPLPRVSVHSSGISSAGLRMLGMLIIALGLMVVSMAFVPSEGEGVVVIFPFVFTNVGGWAAVALTLGFLGLFLAMSFLPWFLASKGGWGRRFGPRNWEYIGSETTEYIITIDLPKGLRKTIYIESGEGVVYIRSSADPSFHRSYSLPGGFDIDTYNYEYESNYLLLKLKLIKRI